MGWDSGLHKKNRVSWAPEFISLCFLTMDTMRQSVVRPSQPWRTAPLNCEPKYTQVAFAGQFFTTMRNTADIHLHSDDLKSFLDEPHDSKDSSQDTLRGRQSKEAELGTEAKPNHRLSKNCHRCIISTIQSQDGEIHYLVHGDRRRLCPPRLGSPPCMLQIGKGRLRWKRSRGQIWSESAVPSSAFD